MKKFFLVFVYFFSAYSGFCFLPEEISFEKLDFFQIARLSQSVMSLEAKKYRHFYAPRLYFSSDGKISGDMADGWETIFASPSVGFSQELPGLASISLESGYNFIFTEDTNDFSNSMSQSLVLRLPLAFNKTMVAAADDFARNYYRKKKHLASLVFYNAISAGTKDFVSAVGNAVYYRDLIFLNERRLAFFEKLNEDCEKLFALGKITSIELSEQYSKFRDLINDQHNCRVSLVSFEQKIFEFGENLPNDTISFEKFVVFCENLVSGRKETFFSDEAEFLQMETDCMKSAISFKSALSYLTAGFSVTSRYSQNEFLSFENPGWSFTLSFKIPCFPDVLNISEMNKYALSDKLYQLEKAKIIRSQEYSKKSRAAALKLYEDSVLHKEKLLELEEKRLESYKNLMALGRLSESDFLAQKDEAEFARLQLLYSRFQLAVLKLGFY